jgi:hypothetical protein
MADNLAKRILDLNTIEPDVTYYILVFNATETNKALLNNVVSDVVSTVDAVGSLLTATAEGEYSFVKPLTTYPLFGTEDYILVYNSEGYVEWVQPSAVASVLPFTTSSSDGDVLEVTAEGTYQWVNPTISSGTPVFLSVVEYDDTDSPVTLTSSDVDKCFVLDATSGNIVVNLPVASTMTTGDVIGFIRIDSSGNTVTLQRQSTDLVNGATSITLSQWDEARICNVSSSEYVNAYV